MRMGLLFESECGLEGADSVSNFEDWQIRQKPFAVKQGPSEKSVERFGLFGRDVLLVGRLERNLSNQFGINAE